MIKHGFLITDKGLGLAAHKKSNRLAVKAELEVFKFNLKNYEK